MVHDSMNHTVNLLGLIMLTKDIDKAFNIDGTVRGVFRVSNGARYLECTENLSVDNPDIDFTCSMLVKYHDSVDKAVFLGFLKG